MKKKLCYILVMFFLLQLVNVKAIDEVKLKIISKDNTDSLNTETFNYKNVSISDNGSSARFNFESITNNTDKNNSVSINILLFDEKKENIGFVTYCSLKDLESDYAQYNLKPKQSTAFYIDISKKYFVEGKNVSNIFYFSILDDNKYCHIGGYDKYKGMSFDQISKDLSSSSSIDDSNNKSNKVIEYLQKINLKEKIVPIIIIILVFLFRGFITNALYKIMYANASLLSFIPVCTDYVSIKLTFGDLVAKCFIVSNIVILTLSFIDFFRALAYIFAFVGIVGFIIVIIKLITKKYEMLILTKSKIKDIISDKVSIDDVEVLNDNDKNTEDSSSIIENIDNVQDQVVDISYTKTNNSNDFPDFSKSVQENENNVQDNNNDGGSDLTNMFR